MTMKLIKCVFPLLAVLSLTACPGVFAHAVSNDTVSNGVVGPEAVQIGVTQGLLHLLSPTEAVLNL